MVEDFNHPIQIVGIDIVREEMDLHVVREMYI